MTTTINTVACNIKSCKASIVKKTNYIPTAGGNINNISEGGSDGIKLDIVGFEIDQDTYNEVIKEFMDTGEQILVINSNWEFRIYSTVFAPVLNAGHGEGKFFNYGLTCLTSTPYKYSTTDIERPKTITADGQEWYEDNASNDIDTDGTVQTPVDIEIIADPTPSSENAIINQTERYT